jgi:hypothetical protein
VGSAQSRWVLKFGPIVPRKLGVNGSLLTRRWRSRIRTLGPPTGDSIFHGGKRALSLTH